MRRRESSRRFVAWSLEATVELLARKFGPSALVVAVRPDEFHLGTISVFRNFVASDAHGNPFFDGTTDKAWRQLDDIMEAVEENVARGDGGPTGAGSGDGGGGGDSNADFRRSPVSLVGFSKGCVVLNQLIHECSSFSRDEKRPEETTTTTTTTTTTATWLKTPAEVKKMYWLDGGHNGTSDTWVTDGDALAAFSDFYRSKPLEIHVGVTPYQMNDRRRPHIGRQKLTFCRMIAESGLSLREKTYFQDQNRSIETHFEVLTAF